MKLLIELPTWLGDAVMATPAIESIIHYYPTAEISLIGSYSSTQALRFHPKVIKTYIAEKNIINLLKTINSLNEFDVFFSFRGSMRARMTKLLVPAKMTFQFNYKKYINKHQVEKYNCFINDSLGIELLPGKLKLYHSVVRRKNNKKNKLLGINPGASYGSAKRWHPKKFSDVAAELSDDFDIIIFGGKSETNFASDIEKNLTTASITNYQNLAGKTELDELIYLISELDIFITGDSGPMHIAAALGIPTISIFGPTNDKETSQWMNSKSVTIKKNLNCQPCMKRTCPLKHQDCMKLITASEVIVEAKRLG